MENNVNPDFVILLCFHVDVNPMHFHIEYPRSLADFCSQEYWYKSISFFALLTLLFYNSDGLDKPTANPESLQPICTESGFINSDGNGLYYITILTVGLNWTNNYCNLSGLNNDLWLGRVLRKYYAKTFLPAKNVIDLNLHICIYF